MKTLHIEEVDNIALVRIDLPNEKVNKLSSSVMFELEKNIKSFRDSNYKAIVFISKKKDFVAGADISEIQDITEEKKAKELSSRGQEILNQLEDLPIPSIAAIEGACLGGGYEFALACDYRIAGGSAQIGLPETKLGLIPGLGGTFRLPKLVGLIEGLNMILPGKNVYAKKALRIGLIDELVPSEILEERALKIACTKKKRKHEVSNRKKLFCLIAKPLITFQAKKQTLKKTYGNYPAPIKAIEVIKSSYGGTRDKAMQMESDAFSKLAITDVSKNLIKLFYMTRTVRKNKDIKPKQVKNVAVLGAGTMGGGIAALTAQNKIRTRMKDLYSKSLLIGFKQAHRVWKSDLKKRKINKYEYQANMDRLTGSLDYNGFKKADVVIEAIVEDMEIKKKAISEMSKHCNEDCIVATNTSSLSVHEMSKSYFNRENFVGMHFFNPVNKMSLVEVIRTDETSDQTVTTILDFAKRMGKFPVVVKDRPGFLVNRLLLPYLNEAVYLLEDGFSVESIDNSFLKFGLPMGPIRLLDEIGIDVAVKVAKILHEAFGKRAEPSGLMQKLISNKRFGKKGKGFYIYKKGRAIGVDNTIYDELGIKVERSKSTNDLVDRGIFSMINEAAVAFFDDKVVESASDVDFAMIMGTGFPPFTGGLLNYADKVGLKKVVEKLDHFYQLTQHERFKCASSLRDNFVMGTR